MLLSKYLLPELILLKVECSDKWDLIDKMVSTIMNSPSLCSHSAINEQHVKESILTREKKFFNRAR